MPLNAHTLSDLKMLEAYAHYRLAYLFVRQDNPDAAASPSRQPTAWRQSLIRPVCSLRCTRCKARSSWPAAAAGGQPPDRALDRAGRELNEDLSLGVSLRLLSQVHLAAGDFQEYWRLSKKALPAGGQDIMKPYAAGCSWRWP